MYELLRYYEDIPYLGKSHASSNMILEDAYLPEDHEKELRTNIDTTQFFYSERSHNTVPIKV